MNIERLLNEYVDDLNAGVSPRLYEMEGIDWDELTPLLQFVNWYKLCTIELPEHIKQSILKKVLK